MGPTFYVLPTLTTAWVGWLLFTPFLRWPIRRLGTVVACALAVGYFTLVRFEGVNGEFAASMPFRWTPSAEERFNAEVANKPAAKPVAATPVVLHPGDWPGFRGADRDGRLAGARIGSDWTHHPPKPLWKHRVGPGWSSIAVVDNRLYTQEQRNEKDEAVVCYDADTGAEVWVHTDSTRFTEGIAGPGPRATPTFHEGRLYSLGANGHLNCLNAADGKVIWSRDVVKDSKATIPMWGYSASPLVAGGVVLVYAEQGDGESLVAYKTADGERAWAVTAGKWSYSSPQAVKLAGARPGPNDDGRRAGVHRSRNGQDTLAARLAAGRANEPHHPAGRGRRKRPPARQPLRQGHAPPARQTRRRQVGRR